MTEIQQIIHFFNYEAPTLNMKAEDLQNPTSDFVIKIYYFMCDLIYDIEGAGQGGFNEFKGELVARPVMIMRTAQYLTSFFSQLHDGKNEFTYPDLLMPIPQRTRMFLNNLIRFYLFKLERQPELEAVANELESHQRDLQTERAFADNTNIKLQKDREALDMYERKHKELLGKQMSLQKELNQKKSAKEKVKRELEEKMHLHDELLERISNLRQNLEETLEHSKRLEMNIVSSPDRILSEINKDEEELKDLNQRFMQAFHDSRKLERDLNIQQNVFKTVEGLKEQLQKLEEVQDRLAGLRRMEDQRQKELSDVHLRRKSLAQELSDLELNYQTQMREFDNEIKLNKRNQAIVRQEKENLEKDIRELTTRQTKAKEESRTYQTKLKQMERDFQIITDKYDDAVDKLGRECKVIDDRVKLQDENLANVSEKARSVYNIQNI